MLQFRAKVALHHEGCPHASHIEGMGIPSGRALATIEVLADHLGNHDDEFVDAFLLKLWVVLVVALFEIQFVDVFY
ncbi:hypothetical protein ACMDCR_25515 [Labrys okinawensis]|uniref:hypothetical protein n=1 Tax=Labrys okinawensis TaxID=346911 RepID=UPI0039BCC342